VYETSDPPAVLCAENVPQAVPLQLDPVALQITSPPSLDVAVRDKLCVTVSAARRGRIETPFAGLIVMARDSLCAVSAGLPESMTPKLKPVVRPAVVGIPVIVPAVDSESPSGSVPLPSDHL
jgi:hypothetical protein